MKATYIFPPLGHAGRKVRSIPLAPPVLEYMGGLTTALRPDWQLRLINANVEGFSPENLDADIVGITILTHQARWAYGTADALRKRGIKVVLGGPHPSVMTDEALMHADSVIKGEAEGVMDGVFGDFEKGSLKPLYEGELLPLDGLPYPRRDLMKGYVFHSFSTSRGCPYGCRFCVTPRLHGHRVRYRPIGDVIADISSFRHKLWFSTDADIWGPDVSRYIDLFKEMAGSLRINWIGEGNIASVQHPRGKEMLKWARRSGLMQIWVGWESFDPETLKAYGATQKMLSGREDALRLIKDSGIDVVLFLMMGAKGERMDEYERVLELCDRLAVTAHPVMVVPYPGTGLYEELKSEISYGASWDFYDGMHSMFGEGVGADFALKDLWLRLFTYPRIFKRLRGLPWKGFPSAHIASFIVQYALRGAFREYVSVKKHEAPGGTGQ